MTIAVHIAIHEGFTEDKLEKQGVPPDIIADLDTIYKHLPVDDNHREQIKKKTATWLAVNILWKNKKNAEKNRKGAEWALVNNPDRPHKKLPQIGYVTDEQLAAVLFWATVNKIDMRSQIKLETIEQQVKRAWPIYQNEKGQKVLDKDDPFADEAIDYEFEDGHKMVAVNSAAKCKIEGQKMRHCVGGYGGRVERYELDIWSLRTPQNKPVVTIEIKDGTVIQVRGHGDRGQLMQNTEKKYIDEWQKSQHYIDNVLPGRVAKLSGREQEMLNHRRSLSKLNISTVTDPNILREYVAFEDQAWNLQKAFNNPNMPADIIDQLVTHDNPAVRVLLANGKINTELPNDWIDLLARDPAPQVRAALLHNPVIYQQPGLRGAKKTLKVGGEETYRAFLTDQVFNALKELFSASFARMLIRRYAELVTHNWQKFLEHPKLDFDDKVKIMGTIADGYNATSAFKLIVANTPDITTDQIERVISSAKDKDTLLSLYSEEGKATNLQELTPLALRIALAQAKETVAEESGQDERHAKSYNGAITIFQSEGDERRRQLITQILEKYPTQAPALAKEEVDGLVTLDQELVDRLFSPGGVLHDKIGEVLSAGPTKKDGVRPGPGIDLKLLDKMLHYADRPLTTIDPEALVDLMNGMVLADREKESNLINRAFDAVWSFPHMQKLGAWKSKPHLITNPKALVDLMSRPTKTNQTWIRYVLNHSPAADTSPVIRSIFEMVSRTNGWSELKASAVKRIADFSHHMTPKMTALLLKRAKELGLEIVAAELSNANKSEEELIAMAKTPAVAQNVLLRHYNKLSPEVKEALVIKAVDKNRLGLVANAIADNPQKFADIDVYGVLAKTMKKGPRERIFSRLVNDLLPLMTAPPEIAKMFASTTTAASLLAIKKMMLDFAEHNIKSQQQRNARRGDDFGRDIKAYQGRRLGRTLAPLLAYKDLPSSFIGLLDDVGAAELQSTMTKDETSEHSNLLGKMIDAVSPSPVRRKSHK